VNAERHWTSSLPQQNASTKPSSTLTIQEITHHANHDVPGVHPVDIHTHYFPRKLLLTSSRKKGPRFNVEYRASEEGFYIKTEVSFQGPLPYRLIDLKKRIADMDAQGTAVQAMSLTGPMAHWATKTYPTNCHASWNDAASVAHSSTLRGCFGLLTLPMLFPGSRHR